MNFPLRCDWKGLKPGEEYCIVLFILYLPWVIIFKEENEEIRRSFKVNLASYVLNCQAFGSINLINIYILRLGSHITEILSDYSFHSYVWVTPAGNRKQIHDVLGKI